jgi:XTP/dITP diphosphohydrolase
VRVVLASANPDKAAEMRAVLAAAVPGLEVLPRPAGVPDVVEDADTLEGNARLKAVAVCEATGEVAVADDTGLAVDALGGAPGVFSARYAGEGASYEDNVAKLLAALDGVPEAQRTARFETVALARFPDGREVSVLGVLTGRITTEPRGGNGFGYDPVFAPDGADGRTFAEMSPAEKDELSHRGKAFRALAERLAALPAP